MKPSERIKEIFYELNTKNDFGFEKNIIDSIIQYLDEEYEKNKPCEHKNTHDSADGLYDVCKDCGVVGFFK